MPKNSLKTKICENSLRRDRFNDISSWHFISREAKGSRAKSILKRGNKTYLFKQPNEDFEIFSEIFNSILANELEINHVQYFPATYHQQNGVVCERFLRSEVDQLIEMKELLYRYSANLQKIAPSDFERMKGREPDAVKEQDIQNIFMIIKEECDLPSVFQAFFKMIGFDALIGHTDRHWENYGILLALNKRMVPSIKFAPVYDTVSTYLGGSFSEAHLKKMLSKDLKDTNWYKPKTKKNCKIKVPGNEQANHFDLLKFIASDEALRVYKKYLFWAFDRFDPKVAKEIIRRFFPDLSDLRREATLEILCQRQRIGGDLKKEL